MAKTNSDGQTFGSWLLAQRDRRSAGGDLIAVAKADRKFPKYGTPEGARKHLSTMQAGADLFEAVDEAETDWLAC